MEILLTCALSLRTYLPSTYLLPTCLPTYLPTYLPAYLPTYLPACLPTYLPTYLLITCLLTQVFLVEVEGEGKVVYTPEATFRARAVVLATGAMGRPPSFKGEDTYLGKGVSYCATCDGAFYDGCEVAVAGHNMEAS